MNDEGLADVAAANPFRLPRLAERFVRATVALGSSRQCVFTDMSCDPVAVLLPTLAPKPDSQGRQHDEGQNADPERDADSARSHVHTEGLGAAVRGQSARG